MFDDDAAVLVLPDMKKDEKTTRLSHVFFLSIPVFTK